MESVARLIIAAETPLAAQVGVVTGLVVVGDLLSTGETWEEAVVGDTPNRPQSRWRSPGSRTSYPVGSTSNPELCRAMISGRKSRLASWNWCDVESFQIERSNQCYELIASLAPSALKTLQTFC
jgi:hypothetical protein